MNSGHSVRPHSTEPITVPDAQPNRPVRLNSLPPLSLYIHLPWCARKCPYCDFNSHTVNGALPETAYTDALITDLDGSLPAVWGRRVHSIFIGGGTPSLFSSRELDRLLSAVRARIPVTPDAEITIEANPGAIESTKFEEFRSIGINRLSIGIQSFNDRHLHALGRIHSANEAEHAVRLAARTFQNYNLDLMFALPGQTPAELRTDLAVALEYGPPHLSVYHLTIEPNTQFAKYPPTIPDSDEAAELQDIVDATLDEAGYGNYEVSAHANPGSRCVHNLNYWTFGDYLGIGAGAHGKISFADRITRTARTRNPTEYIERACHGTHIVDQHTVETYDLPFEFMMNALRLTDGIPLQLFAERTGRPLTEILRTLERAEHMGLLERDHFRMRPTPLGRRFLNDLTQLFLPG